jgi:hypothetical protein
MYHIEIVLPPSVLDGPHALGQVASTLRARIAGVTGADLPDLVAFIEREGNTVLIDVVDRAQTTTVLLTSHSRFGMHALDFGPRLGHIDAYRLPAAGIVPGLHIVMPRLPDGSCEVMVAEAKQTMVELAKDPEWTRFTTLME